MGIVRTAIILGLGYLALKTMQRVIANMEAQKVKVRAKASDMKAHMPKLKLDPVTGVYRPEA